MIATLGRRISRLENNLPPPPAELPDDDLRWWHEAPEAVRAYFVTVHQEIVQHYAGEPEPDADELSDWMGVRHPLFWAARFALEQGYPLRRAQHHVLCMALLHLSEGLHPDFGDRAARNEVAYRRGLGIDAREGGRRYADHTGAGLVDAWRAHRARGEPCPSWCHYMGLSRPELDFLAADE